jgi:hypothetical protein
MIPKPAPRLPKPKRPPNRVNAKRKAMAFIRAYHSEQRVKWVQSLPCLIAGPACGGRMENHHIKGGGGSLKSSYTNITPLCTAHHDELHAHGTPTFEAKYDLSLADQAARVESRWTLLHPEIC